MGPNSAAGKFNRCPLSKPAAETFNRSTRWARCGPPPWAYLAAAGRVAPANRQIETGTLGSGRPRPSAATISPLAASTCKAHGTLLSLCHRHAITCHRHNNMTIHDDINY